MSSAEERFVEHRGLKLDQAIDGANDRRVGIARRSVDQEGKCDAPVMQRVRVTRERRDVGQVSALRAHAAEGGREIVIFQRALAAA